MTRLAIVKEPAFDVDAIQIASPCHARWDDMHGDDRVRFCFSCRKNVYTLDGMSKREIRALFEETEGKACVRLYRRADGTVLTADCPVGLAAKARAAARRVYVMSIALVVTLSTAALAMVFGKSKTCDTGGRLMGAPPPVAVVEPNKRLMGEPMAVDAYEMGGAPAPFEPEHVTGEVDVKDNRLVR